MAKNTKTSLARRAFMKRAAAGAAMLAATPIAGAQESPRAKTPLMSPQAESETPPQPAITLDRPGADYMTDVIKSLGFEYVCANPGSSFRGLHESLINYGGNQSPEFLTCCHEESSVAMAHGYFKIEGRPLLVMAHGTVGLQHASMAIYNAYCDRVPVFVIVGNLVDATKRRPGAEWAHSVQDAVAMVRDYTKWDDLPASLTHFGESAVRAYEIAMTPPTMPVVLVADGELQEGPVNGSPPVPKLTIPIPPQGDSAALAEAARLLVAAENPVIVADRLARTPAGMARLVELAEALQAAVVDHGGRLNFPSRHPLNQTQRSRAVLGSADVILALELADFWGVVNSFSDQLQRSSHRLAKADAKLIRIGAGELDLKSNYQEFQRFQPVDLDIAGDGESSLPILINAVKRLRTGDRQSVFQQRGAKLAQAAQNAAQRAVDDARYAWDATPISTARLTSELWEQIKNEDWSVVSEINFISRWPMRLWPFEKPYQFIGGAGGAGVGYGAPAAVGAALANRKHGRLSINIQNDGDLMYAPGVLWTAAHHRIPLLTIMHNNHAYHQELMHIQRMANRHNRGVDRARIGTTMDDPAIDFASLAKGLGIYSQGPITNPNELAPALQKAIAVVKRGEPALVDVFTQPR